ncbi:MAG: hypothetical protein M1546_20945 [Chloroflexi bacterium]|nr:hypothetical protein [Chloroflexota bacterium]
MTRNDTKVAGMVTLEIVRKAIMGAHIRNNTALHASYGGIPPECVSAAEVIVAHMGEFEELLWQRLSQLPLTLKFFGRLVRKRLKQRGILASPIVAVVFNDDQALEQRLAHIQHIPGVEEFKREYRGSDDPTRGGETDRKMADLLAEIFVLDSLVQLGFSNIQKVQDQNSKSHIDIITERDGRVYAIDVTRREEITDWETIQIPGMEDSGLEDCNSATNLERIRKLLLSEIRSKEKRFRHSLTDGTIESSMVKVVAIKTSDYGFAECISQAKRITSELMSQAQGNALTCIDCVWLLPNIDVQQSQWVFKTHNAMEILKNHKYTDESAAC